ncbi:MULTISPECIES: glycosyltransferase family 2 protein [Prevotella]|jgi:glycosyltransferase involved in cell wall biosynthesis|uniref:Dolichol-phosphate mannosyltransferase n=1 Tax=Prevotella lacticifex TaxID=2854755 RepID=A0A9R1C8Y5_9BACT|nr:MULTISPECIES: glycosyltransferase family 2 protein [Prevotella]MDD6854801.1 glycosyltransferase family 2 protein [Prevotella sp.]GJG37512.1 dolichol-phosphate mannosyltransferase [Prevotella lacticifex]GJG40695.1 dolichol-phosphate mannosyltransferase [Prevotella lacticifex]GJG44392.1 dolichol-phosphate mannosyltransferase [Prevotella lacticifex]GJG47075.1 dolichol-phosphate mannosyltransferase [Prevotella lacticifex]
MNKTKDYELSIIIPVYNEEDNLDRVEKELSAFLPHALVRSCVLFVNDGSRDTSLDRIKAICSRHDDFFYISSTANHGLSTAMKAGIDAIESRLTGYIDSDLQTNPEDFNLLLEYAADYQLVAGIRAKRKDTFFKRLQSKIANGFRRSMTGDTATDTGCPLKVMWSSYAKRLPFFDGMHRFLPALMMLEEGRFKELPVRHYPRTAGVSKYHLWNRLKGPFLDCFAYRWMKKRYIRYHVDESNIG